MRKFILCTTVLVGLSSFAQTVTTLAGLANDDPTTNYESRTSDVNLDDTYFAYPNGLCFDNGGRLFVSERNKIRMIAGSKIYIRGGNPGSPTLSEGYLNNTGTQATFRNPGGMVCDTLGNIYIADAENHAIRKMAKFVNVSNGQAISTFAGANPPGSIPGYGTSGSADGTGSNARFNQPQGITIDANGNLYVTDYLNFTIRKITPAGLVSTISGKAGIEGTTDNSTGANARFGGPWGIAFLDANNLVITDPWNTNIRKVNISTGATTTIAGPTSGADPRHVDGTLSQARFKAPKGVAVINGIIYVADQNLIRAIDIDNNSVTTFAGEKNTYEVLDGVGGNAGFTEIDGMTALGSALYVTENSGAVSSHVVRKITIDDLNPVADFIASNRNLIVNEHSILKDISTGATTISRNWTITPSSYSLHAGNLSSDSLELSFGVTGFFKVKLSITNQYGSDSVERENYFNVSTTGSIQAYTANHLVEVYPNPASDVIYIDFAPEFMLDKTNMYLYNSAGELIWSDLAKNQISTLDLSNGVYYLSIEDGDLKAIKKCIVSH